jgi:hypothetical protein
MHNNMHQIQQINNIYQVKQIQQINNIQYQHVHKALIKKNNLVCFDWWKYFIIYPRMISRTDKTFFFLSNSRIISSSLFSFFLAFHGISFFLVWFSFYGDDKPEWSEFCSTNTSIHKNDLLFTYLLIIFCFFFFFFNVVLCFLLLTFSCLVFLASICTVTIKMKNLK